MSFTLVGVPDPRFRTFVCAGTELISGRSRASYKGQKRLRKKSFKLFFYNTSERYTKNSQQIELHQRLSRAHIVNRGVTMKYYRQCVEFLFILAERWIWKFLRDAFQPPILPNNINFLDPLMVYSTSRDWFLLKGESSVVSFKSWMVEQIIGRIILLLSWVHNEVTTSAETGMRSPARFSTLTGLKIEVHSGYSSQIWRSNESSNDLCNYRATITILNSASLHCLHLSAEKRDRITLAKSFWNLSISCEWKKLMTQVTWKLVGSTSVSRDYPLLYRTCSTRGKNLN